MRLLTSNRIGSRMAVMDSTFFRTVRTLDSKIQNKVVRLEVSRADAMTLPARREYSGSSLTAIIEISEAIHLQ